MSALLRKVSLQGVESLFFFGLIITYVRPIEIVARVCTVQFLSAVCAVAAHC